MYGDGMVVIEKWRVLRYADLRIKKNERSEMFTRAN